MKRLILGLILLLPLPALANAPYVVSGVTVDVTADSAGEARNQAIIEGQRKAFMNLATQLVPGETIPDVTDTQIGNMVSDFRIEKEQFGAKRYVATFTFRFRQNPVRVAFGNAAIPSPHELAARPPAPTETVTTTVITSTTETTADSLPPVAAAPDATELVPDAPRDVAAIISNEAAQGLPPVAATADSLPPVLTVENNPLPAGVDANSPIKIMLIESANKNPAALQMAADKLRRTPGVIDLAYGASQKVVRMAYRGDTAQLVSNLQGRGISLQQKVPTQPPLYTISP
ncbi:MAG TPA: hypothetical protein PKW15_08420 [Alphaproteobacteria bacterium]|nr:hypothetical protein [Rhodospirillaceae bacterium]HRJ13250.1 hypothetical protein [Alphaproteobacteria bacterium]